MAVGSEDLPTRGFFVQRQRHERLRSDSGQSDGCGCVSFGGNQTTGSYTVKTVRTEWCNNRKRINQDKLLVGSTDLSSSLIIRLIREKAFRGKRAVMIILAELKKKKPQKEEYELSRSSRRLNSRLMQ
ncbi:hypothetical protein BY996DRAFT_8398640 [Phakopsora pachyrhizi]|nr:hypothetical protein BY996DRAFT_8398640 [Phakopsora pachyrhizi]